MIEAMKQALEALKDVGVLTDREWQAVHKNKANELRQAIAELESQEPVAWSCWQSCLNDDGTQTSPWVHRLSKFKPHESIINKDIVPLYTYPPQRTWQGLTEDDKVLIKHDANFNQFMTAGEYADRVQQLTEARLKDKNT